MQWLAGEARAVAFHMRNNGNPNKSVNNMPVAIDIISVRRHTASSGTHTWSKNRVDYGAERATNTLRSLNSEVVTGAPQRRAQVPTVLLCGLGAGPALTEMQNFPNAWRRTDCLVLRVIAQTNKTSYTQYYHRIPMAVRFGTHLTMTGQSCYDAAGVQVCIPISKSLPVLCLISLGARSVCACALLTRV